MSLEVKWTDLPVTNHDKISGLIEFGVKNSSARLVLTSKFIYTVIAKQGLKIEVIPAALLAYTAGEFIG